MTNRRGAPPGNKNALKHGKYTRERRALLAEVRAYIWRGRALIAQSTFSGPPECQDAPPELVHKYLAANPP